MPINYLKRTILLVKSNLSIDTSPHPPILLTRKKCILTRITQPFQYYFFNANAAKLFLHSILSYIYLIINYMRHRILTIVLTAICLSTSCSPPSDLPLGNWQSTQGRATLTILKDNLGNYQAIIHHQTAYGYTCPIVYPIVRKPYGIYIQAEGRIILTYSSENNTLFLSPGGRYTQKKDTFNEKMHN